MNMALWRNLLAAADSESVGRNTVGIGLPLAPPNDFPLTFRSKALYFQYDRCIYRTHRS